MEIQFRCTNVSHFDQNGEYQQCNQLLQVSSDNVGLNVRCPRCNQMTVVPSRAMAMTAGGSVETESETAAGETVARVQSELSYGKFSRHTRCPKCGSLLDDEKKCTSCRYETPLVKMSSVPISQMTVKPAGFQLWFRNIMSDGVGGTVFEVALHSFLLVVVLALLIMAVVIGGSASIYIILAAVGLGMIYLLVVPDQTDGHGTRNTFAILHEAVLEHVAALRTNAELAKIRFAFGGSIDYRHAGGTIQ